MAMNVSEELQKKLDQSGRISSSDVASFSVDASSEDKKKATIDEAINKDTEVDLEESGDPTLARARIETFGRSDGKAILTAQDKKDFIKALVGNKRYTREYRALDGNIKLTLRSRTVEETNAMIAEFAKESSEGLLRTSAIQTNRLRSLMMVFQIEEYNGTKYESPSKPLVRTVSDDGEAEPKWLDRVSTWEEIPDALHCVIWECIKDFEDRYWTMTENASIPDFWQPVASI